MHPLIGVAASIFPDIIPAVASEDSRAVREEVIAAVKDATKVDDPHQVSQVLMANPRIAEALKVRLSTILLDAKSQARERHAALAEQDWDKRARAEREKARESLLALVKSGSWTSWTGPVISAIVVIGFLWLLGYLVSNPDKLNVENQNAFQIINIAIGALVAAFTTVVNFWLGSSEGSRRKDVVNFLQQETEAKGGAGGEGP
ncbi:MAG TPA: hypothetical protein VGU45_14075 [Microvirga sp.]|jgi:hypothetical protein|nr:hypothetical protein [Microvirga sp.]